MSLSRDATLAYVDMCGAQAHTRALYEGLSSVDCYPWGPTHMLKIHCTILGDTATYTSVVRQFFSHFACELWFEEKKFLLLRFPFRMLHATLAQTEGSSAQLSAASEAKLIGTMSMDSGSRGLLVYQPE